MSRKRVKNDVRALDDLPLFRDTANKSAAARVSEIDAIVAEVMDHVEPEPAAGSTDAQPAELEPDDVASAATEIGGDADGEPADLDAALSSLDDPTPDAAAPAPRPRQQPTPITLPSALHGLWTGIGIVLCVLGLAGAVLAAAQPAALAGLHDALMRIGFTPSLLLGFGMAACGIGTLLGRQLQQTEHIARITNSVHELITVADQVDATTRALHAADDARTATAMSGDEFGQVLFALQRNEEKLINLTKATKTFGKPLIEMTSQVADAAAQAAQSQSLIQALRVSTENGMGKLEEALRKQDGQTPAETAALRTALEQLRTDVQGKLDTALREVKASPDAVQRQLQSLSGTLEGKLTSLAQRLHDDLEGVSKDLAGKLAELGKGGKDVAVNLGPVQNAIAELRRDLQSLGSSTGRSATAAAAPAATPGPAPAEEPPPASGLASSIAGERNSKGGNVLGAIAKLKKLRG
jgi:hypothetical protein